MQTVFLRILLFHVEGMKNSRHVLKVVRTRIVERRNSIQCADWGKHVIWEGNQGRAEHSKAKMEECRMGTEWTGNSCAKHTMWHGPEWLCPIRAMSTDIFGVNTGDGRNSREQSPGMLLNILQCTGQLPITRNYQRNSPKELPNALTGY